MNSVISISYFDEHEIWPEIGGELLHRKNLHKIDLLTSEFELTLSELPIRYYSHSESVWEPDAEDTYKKPYVWIYIIQAPSLDYYVREQRELLFRWAASMKEMQIEWLVLYIPSSEPMQRSLQKQYTRAYDKIASDIQELSGSKFKCSRLYSNLHKQFLSIDQAASSDNSYWENFAECISVALSINLHERIKLYTGRVIYHEESDDFYNFSLAKEGLAIIYQMCGLCVLAKECYDELRAPTEVFSIMQFEPVSLEDIHKDAPVHTDAFRDALRAGNISELAFREYVFYRQKELLEIMGEFAKVGELALNFVSMCMRIFSCLEDSSIGNQWIYKTTHKLGTDLKNSVDKITNSEMKSNVHYAVGLLFSIARSRLERTIDQDICLMKDLDLNTPLPMYKVDKEMLKLCCLLYEEQSMSGYMRVADRYKLEYAVILFKSGRYAQSANLLSSIRIEKWPNLNICARKYELQCYLQLQNTPACLNTSIELLGSLKSNQVWRFVENLSGSFSCHSFTCDKLFDIKIIFASAKIEIGQDIECICKIYNPFNLEIEFDKASLSFSHILVSSHGKVLLKSGENQVTFTGKALVKGKFSCNRVILQLKKLQIYSVVNTQKIVVEETKKYLKIKQRVPELLVVDQVQVLVIEIYTFQENLTNCSVFLGTVSVIYNNEAEFIICNEDGSTCSYVLDISENTIRLPNLRLRSKYFLKLNLYVTKTEKDKSYKLHSQNYSFGLTFYFNSPFSEHVKAEESYSLLSFTQPLKVVSQVFKRKKVYAVQLSIFNLANLELLINNLEVQDSRLLENPCAVPQYFRPLERIFIAFLVKDIEKLDVAIRYSAKDLHFVYKLPCLSEGVVKMKHSGKAIIGEQYSVHLQFFKKGKIVIKVDSSPVWKVPDLFEGYVEKDAELILIPKKNGYWDLPKLSILLEGNKLQVLGSRTVMCHPRLGLLS